MLEGYYQRFFALADSLFEVHMSSCPSLVVVCSSCLFPPRFANPPQTEAVEKRIALPHSNMLEGTVNVSEDRWLPLYTLQALYTAAVRRLCS